MKMLMAALLVAALSSACGEVPTTPSGNLATSTFLSFTSAPGDAIGQGESHHYTLTDGSWRARFDRVAGVEHLVVSLNLLDGPPTSVWTLNLSPRRGDLLDVGTYEAARRWPFQPPDQPGLDFSGFGRTCKTLTGRFLIHQLVLGPANTVDRLHVTFEQHCDGASPALSGELAIVSDPWR